MKLQEYMNDGANWLIKDMRDFIKEQQKNM